VSEDERLLLRLRLLWNEETQGAWPAIDAMDEAAGVIDRLRARVAALEAENAYLTWKLRSIIPLFEEARDALCAIPLANAKLRNIDLTLGDRMDRAGTATRADFDAARAKDGSK